MPGFIIVLILGALLVAWRWSTRRGQLLWGAVFTIPVIVTNLVIAGSWQRLGVNGLDAAWSVAKLVIGTMSAGAILALLYEQTLNRWLTPVTNPGRHRLLWLAIGIVVGGALFLTGAPLVLSIAVGLLVNMGVVLVVNRQLFWDIIVGAIGFAVWFALADVVFGIRASGDAASLLIGTKSLGFTISGLAVERLIALAGLGALISPLFVALKRQRLPDQPIGTTISVLKIGLASVVVVVCAMVATAFTIAYVQPPRVLALTPAIGTTALPSTSIISLQFSHPVDRDSIALVIDPPINGSWQFSQPALGGHAFRAATFMADEPLADGTTYQGYVVGIESVWGVASSDQTVRFTTAPAPTPVVPSPAPTPVVEPVPEPVVVAPAPIPTPTPTPPTPAPVATTAVSRQVLLAVKLDYQDRPLSCEAAALKMALANKGVKVTETQIMNHVGYDPTPHRGEIWGDPYEAFVGNIDGKQNTTGYGVYWDPIARAARQWRPARVIVNGSLKDLTTALDAKQAVVIWGTLGKAYRQTWKTPAGKTIAAWKGEHARTLIGYVGTTDKPTKFIINDPIAGRLNWSTATFVSNWSTFNNSAVIVE